MTETSLHSVTMFAVEEAPYCLRITEACGIAHEWQVVEIAVPAAGPALCWLEDAATGRRFPVQRARQAGRGYLFLEVPAFAQFCLRPLEDAGEIDAPVTCQRDGASALLGNGRFTLELPLGEETFPAYTPDLCYHISGPVRRFRVGAGPWRGRTFFDTRLLPLARQGEILEEGPLRTVYRFRLTFAGEAYYQATVTVDAGQVFAAIAEEFHAGAGDQVVWDFAGDDLPHTLDLLNTDADFTSQALPYHFDQRLARLFAWNQYTQLLDLSDGYALRFTDGDAVGFVALAGGQWRGNRLNHLEVWMRRWVTGDPSTRRELPYEAKADTFPSPEVIPARGHSRCEAHLNIEGWLGNGARQFALVLTSVDALLPAEQQAGGPPQPRLEHFEGKPDRERYRAKQCLLRRLHIQRGMLPLSDQAAMSFVWPEETDITSRFAYPHELLTHHLQHADTEEERIRIMLDYLQARVYGFWEGSGAAYSNCVVGRRIAPEMFHLAWLAQEGKLPVDTLRLCRAHLAFLAYLYASDNYYPGRSTMTPLDSDDAVEPTLEGMANQNFYTDVINVFGTAAQVFPRHPASAAWREKFFAMWHQQLQYHVYPESGLWEESHTYYHHVLHTVLPTFLRYNADGVAEEFANPDYQQLVGAAIAQLSTRDAWYGGIRHPVSFGDHGVGGAHYRYLYRAYAAAFAPHNPELAGQLAWAYTEMGGTEPPVAPQPPAWRNQYLQGLGYLFRAVDAEGAESLLAFRCGSAWAHHHNDDGCIQFFAKGRALVVDAAFSEHPQDGEKKFTPAGHSRWTLRDYAPINYLWRFNRGWITAHEAAGRFPYAVGDTPVTMFSTGNQRCAPLKRPIAHTRTIVQLSATAYLIVDHGESELAQVVRFHLPGEAVAVSAAGATAAYDGGCRVRVQPLTGELPCRLTVDHPGSASLDLTTTEVCFDTGTAPLVAFLLTAGAADAPAPVISSEGDGYRLCLGEATIAVAFTPEGIQVSDVRSGERVLIN